MKNPLKWLQNRFNKHERCFGITLWQTRNVHVQVWFCAPYYVIREHCHVESDIELMFLFGKGSIFARRESLETASECFIPEFPKHTGRLFTLKAGTWHYFTVSKWPLVFVNFSKAVTRQAPRSASLDFVLPKEDKI